MEYIKLLGKAREGETGRSFSLRVLSASAVLAATSLCLVISWSTGSVSPATVILASKCDLLCVRGQQCRLSILQKTGYDCKGHSCHWAIPTAITYLKIKPIYVDSDVTDWFKTTQEEIFHLLLRGSLIDSSQTTFIYGKQLTRETAHQGELCSVTFLKCINSPMWAHPSSMANCLNCEFHVFYYLRYKDIRTLYHGSDDQLRWIWETKYLGTLTT